MTLSEFPGSRPKKRGLSRMMVALIGSIDAWILVALIFVLLLRIFEPESKDASNLWFLDPLLSVLFLLVRSLNRRLHWPSRLKLSRRQAAIGFMLISWTVGMLTELSLSLDGGGYGGLHPKTVPSFILAQGYYVPLAVLGWCLVRRYHITSYELFFVAGMTSSYELATVGFPSMFSAMFLFSPILIAFFFVVYARFLSMGLLFIDEELLWDKSQRKISFGRKLLYGILLGIGCWVAFVAWGAAMHKIFNDFKSFSESRMDLGISAIAARR